MDPDLFDAEQIYNADATQNRRKQPLESWFRECPALNARMLRGLWAKVFAGTRPSSTPMATHFTLEFVKCCVRHNVKDRFPEEFEPFIPIFIDALRAKLGRDFGLRTPDALWWRTNRDVAQAVLNAAVVDRLYAAGDDKVNMLEELTEVCGNSLGLRLFGSDLSKARAKATTDIVFEALRASRGSTNLYDRTWSDEVLADSRRLLHESDLEDAALHARGISIGFQNVDCALQGASFLNTFEQLRGIFLRELSIGGDVDPYEWEAMFNTFSGIRGAISQEFLRPIQESRQVAQYAIPLVKM
jgi:hypothetical protein